MVRKSFGRSLSFPIPISTHTPGARKITGRGSASLPCRFHPFVSRLHDEIDDLLTWQAAAQARPDTIVNGLACLDRLHASLDDVLQHPQCRDPLRRRSPWTARLLDDFLRFTDAYASLRSAVVTLKDRQSATQSAIRRNDETRIASCARDQRRAEKELARIAAAVRVAGRWSPAVADAEEAELAWAMKAASAAMAAASAAAIGGVAGVSAGAVGGVSRWVKGSLCMVGPMVMGKRREEGEIKWKEAALEKLAALEECIGEVEKMSERLFRSSVNIRVFLLNILTPSL